MCRPLWILVCLTTLAVNACSQGPSGNHATREATWPYTNVVMASATPPSLQGFARFAGRWLLLDETSDRGMAETSDPRYLGLFPVSGGPVSFLDLGAQVEVEAAQFSDRGRGAMLVGAIVSNYGGGTVLSRALLEVDLELGLLVDTVFLDPNAIARGFALDSTRRRAFLLEDHGLDGASVIAIDLYSGQVRTILEVGNVPGALDRKGLVMDHARGELFCAVGGLQTRHDFEPVGSPDDPTPPAILVLDSDSLTVAASIPMPLGLSIRRLSVDPTGQRLVALLEGVPNRLVVVNTDFREVRGVVELPEPVSDVDASSGFAVAPGRDGMYLVDLDLMSVGRIPVLLGITGDIAVTPSLRSAYVFTESPGLVPGIAFVDLQAGRVVGQLQ